MNRAPRRAAGFSLLELLVALFVVVLVTSLVTLSVGGGSGDIRLDSTVRNLANVASYALDEAQLSGVDYGLLLFRRDDVGDDPVYGYGWRQRRPEGWRRPEHDTDVFEEHLLEPGVELRLELEDYPLAELDLQSAGEDAAPQVLLMASGETTPGALELRRERNGEVLWRVEWDLLGRFELLRHGEREDDFDEG